MYRSKNLNLFTILGLIGLSFVLTTVLWEKFDPRGLLVLGTLLLGGEIFTQVKHRQSMICNNCGFDPVLYLRNPEKAGLQIKEYLEARSEKPEYLLRSPVQWAPKARPGDAAKAAAELLIRPKKFSAVAALNAETAKNKLAQAPQIPPTANAGQNLSLRG